MLPELWAGEVVIVGGDIVVGIVEDDPVDIGEVCVEEGLVLFGDGLFDITDESPIGEMVECFAEDGEHVWVEAGFDEEDGFIVGGEEGWEVDMVGEGEMVMLG